MSCKRTSESSKEFTHNVDRLPDYQTVAYDQAVIGHTAGSNVFLNPDNC